MVKRAERNPIETLEEKLATAWQQRDAAVAVLMVIRDIPVADGEPNDGPAAAMRLIARGAVQGLDQ